MRVVGLHLLAALLALVCGLTQARAQAPQPQGPASQPQDWLQLTPPAHARIIYVSQSRGSDHASGLSPDAPVRSIDRGLALVRSGDGDWLLLQRGDTWAQSIDLRKSGRSEHMPLVVGSFGSAPMRPRLRGSISIAGSCVVITGLWLEGPGRTNNPRTTGLATQRAAGVRSLVLEDLLIEGHKYGLNLSDASQVLLRRCIVADNARQGLYIQQTDNLRVIECVFDSNGSDGFAQHNIYKSRGGHDLWFEGNIFHNGSNHGLKIRAPSLNVTVRNNLFVANRNDLAIHLDRDDPPHLLNRHVVVEDNVFLATGREGLECPLYVDHTSDLLIRGNLFTGDAGANWSAAIILGDRGQGGPSNLSQVRVIENTIAFVRGEGIRYATNELVAVEACRNRIQLGEPEADHSTGLQRICNPGEVDLSQLQLAGNVYYSEGPPDAWFEWGNHRSSISLRQWIESTGESDARCRRLRFVEPHRSLASYQATIGGKPSQFAYMAAVRRQSRDSWNPSYAPAAVLAYLRQGFTTADADDDQHAPRQQAVSQ